ncbi:PP2C family protein-serine/threonine phosphatase [Amycolatopsis sp. CA-128772]|uniref:PP2C family protein-serine/threonine phosphatase n=1 Tax=Amycolatopsis sp. CA-128772 TaxID=2073159 RepID=UPI000CD19266|nr:PP2C family protein-serine/threonine phosphatase [Amycolatopsis sp. CA-128772]
MGWDIRHEMVVVERAGVTAPAGYTARAVERALFVDDRVVVARLLQEAMLTELPEVEGLELAALYRPAATGDLVGGDWYDAYPLPAAGPGAATLAVSIGDITGHDTEAATLMGQLRSLLRQADLDHPGAGPADIVTALEHANRTLEIGAGGTLVHGDLRPLPDGAWEPAWTTAGHPRPLVRAADRSVRELSEADLLLFPDGPVARATHRMVLPRGSVLLLYTDGLVERPGADVDAEVAGAGALLATHGDRPLPDLLAELTDRLAGPEPGDDVALLAVRIPGARAAAKPAGPTPATSRTCRPACSAPSHVRCTARLPMRAPVDGPSSNISPGWGEGESGEEASSAELAPDPRADGVDSGVDDGFLLQPDELQGAKNRIAVRGDRERQAGGAGRRDEFSQHGLCVGAQLRGAAEVEVARRGQDDGLGQRREPHGQCGPARSWASLRPRRPWRGQAVLQRGPLRAPVRASRPATESSPGERLR